MSAKLEKIMTWRGTHKDVTFEIKNREWDKDSSLAYDYPTGAWSFYIYLIEDRCADFSRIWLQDRLAGIGEHRKYVTHDYMEGLVGSIDLHGGITFYAKHGYINGRRCVEVGCDYQHLYDSGQHYSEGVIALDAQRAIDSCYELGILKPNA